jgi:hypothetical protein
MFRVIGVGMPLAHIIQEWGTDQCIGVQAFLLHRNESHPSLVILLGTHNLGLGSTRVGIICLHSSFVELVLLSNYVWFVEPFLPFLWPYQAWKTTIPLVQTNSRGYDTVVHIMLQRVPSWCSLDSCCYTKILPRVNSHSISTEILEHMLTTCLQVFDLASHSVHLFGDDRPNCGAT